MSRQVVDHASNDNVQRNGDDVEPDNRWGEVFAGVTHLAHDCDEGLVAGISECDIKDGFELDVHRSQRVWAESHDKRLVRRLPEIAGGVGVGTANG